ncbi:aminotransferase class I/II-fold pyridoxal phosphate-dependent enzyme [Joostella atrarenae]|uniref:Aminotransferase class I/II-fold pyridoxal phosphate-dependent enzyme n=1 Tax=Joostella atrarenae TaxID=679257 RepID=A0ABS9J2M3_9FLAO|nr:aminotransferase class I/II-fold pyridoxal phosphate-dependent enzyme [Joostella atrarenae]MCF8714600.1 aminotransferase class I/II-fold pyridoxal phosphate-dependent enzyme [Joostella atrarenae]
MIHFVEEFPGRIINTEEGSFHYFGGTAYLGLQTHPEFQQLFIKNITKYGTNYGASRKSNIRFSIYNEVETYLANLVGSESCVTLSSGYMASQLVSRFFTSEDYTCYHAPLTHASLLQIGQKPFESYKLLQEKFKQNSKDTTPVIFLDAIDFLGNNYPKFSFLTEIDLSNTILVIDDSHGLGVLGEKGEGVYKIASKLNSKELIVCGSLGKGFGVQAGAIFGTKNSIESLINTSFFGGASPASPAAVSTILEAEKTYTSQIKKLIENDEYLSNKLEDSTFFTKVAKHPTYTFFDEKLTKHLLDNNILITSFNYPEENSPLMSRIVVSAYHTKEDLDFLAKVIKLYK